MTLHERQEVTTEAGAAVLHWPLAASLICQAEANLALQPDATQSLLVYWSQDCGAFDPGNGFVKKKEVSHGHRRALFHLSYASLS